MVIESERAAWGIDLAVSDLILAVTQCRTNDDAIRLSRLIEPLVLKLEACQSAALNKADELSGASR
jgi:hypothetical protein